MNQRQIGAGIVVLGGVLLLIGGVLTFLDSGTEAGGDAAAPTTTSAPANDATSEPSDGGAATTAASSTPTTATSVTTTPATTTPATTTPAATSPPTTAPTTTTVAPTALVEVFIEEFAAALAAGDVEFVFSRLHPALVLGFGEPLCRSWVEAEIMGLSEYMRVGPVSGPTTGSLATPAGDVVFDERYTAPISFVFSGASFDANADFILLDGLVYFTGTCR